MSWNSTSPVLALENLDISGLSLWMRMNWTVSFYVVAFYLIAMEIGIRFMKNRAPIELKTAYLWWNTFWAAIMFLGAFRMGKYLVPLLREKGLDAAICENEVYTNSPTFYFWVCVSVFIRIFEIWGTGFMVLRKIPVSFLQKYHHVLSPTYTFFYYRDLSSPGCLQMTINNFSHFLMYLHFIAKAFNLHVSRFSNSVVTMVQLADMFSGCYINYRLYTIISSGRNCVGIDMEDIVVTSLVYCSLFILIAQFLISQKSSKTYQRSKDE